MVEENPALVPVDVQMLGASSNLRPCEEGSDEHLMFISVLEELERLCNQQFNCFIVLGYT